jgi:hypothetical protein
MPGETTAANSGHATIHKLFCKTLPALSPALAHNSLLRSERHRKRLSPSKPLRSFQGFALRLTAGFEREIARAP